MLPIYPQTEHTNKNSRDDNIATSKTVLYTSVMKSLTAELADVLCLHYYTLSSYYSFLCALHIMLYCHPYFTSPHNMRYTMDIDRQTDKITVELIVWGSLSITDSHPNDCMCVNQFQRQIHMFTISNSIIICNLLFPVFIAGCHHIQWRTH